MHRSLSVCCSSPGTQPTYFCYWEQRHVQRPTTSVYSTATVYLSSESLLVVVQYKDQYQFTVCGILILLLRSYHHCMIQRPAHRPTTNGYCLPVFCIMSSSYALHRSLSFYRLYHINTVVTIVPSLYDPETCPETHYQCPPDGYCLPVFTRCNGHPDCPGQEDESDCDSYVCGGLYRCLGSRACLHPDYVCDGGTQCPR